MADRICIVCGKEISGKRRKYCSEKCCLKMNLKKGSWRNRKTEYEKAGEAENRHKKSQEKIKEINRLAKESGMTYGQYVAKMNTSAVHRDKYRCSRRGE